MKNKVMELLTIGALLNDSEMLSINRPFEGRANLATRFFGKATRVQSRIGEEVPNGNSRRTHKENVKRRKKRRMTKKARSMQRQN